MNKNDFLNALTAALAGLPQEERQKTLDYYSEIIDDAIEDGKDEQTVIAGLGSINEIAEDVINSTPISRFVKEDIRKRSISIPVIILLIIGSPVWLPLLLAFFSAAFSLYLTIWSVIAVLFVIFAALALSGAAMLIASPFLLFVRPLKAMLSFGSALFCLGLSVFMFYLSVLSAKITIKLTVFTARSIKNIFIRSGVNESK